LEHSLPAEGEEPPEELLPVEEDPSPVAVPQAAGRTGLVRSSVAQEAAGSQQRAGEAEEAAVELRRCQLLPACAHGALEAQEPAPVHQEGPEEVEEALRTEAAEELQALPPEEAERTAEDLPVGQLGVQQGER
jgi:hypothetical protein